MVTKKVIKRDGSTVPFDKSHIFNAIKKATNDKNMNNDSVMSDTDINICVNDIVSYINAEKKKFVGVEHIQDIVEDTLILNDYVSTAKSYIRFRQSEATKRKASKKLVDTYNQIFFGDAKDSDLRRDNANINTDAPMGMMLKIGAEAAKSFADNYVIPDKFAKADKENIIHIHDKDFSLICWNCCQLDIKKLFKGGFSTGHGFLREPNSIRSAAALACIAIQSNQNDMFGGQSINSWDSGLAPYVDKSFTKAIKKAAEEWLKFTGFEIPPMNFPDMQYGMPIKDAREIILGNLNVNGIIAEEIDADRIYDVASKSTEEETKQAMEASIHNFNSLHSRAGGQVPFSSINYGMDTSPAGRLVTKMTLEAIYNGLGNGETPIFPISVFQLKADVNYNPGDPNYDLFQLACKVSAKRLFPNFVNIDAPYNLQYYKPGNYNSCVATMGCRTRVMSNVNGPEESGSRGNFSFTTINLPMLALDAKTKYPDDQEKRIEYFFKEFDKYIQLSHDYLQYRYNIIAKKHVYNFPFLMGQGVWMGSEKLKPDDEVGKVLKHASISIGFCGLAECLVALIGKHHGESGDAQKLGLKIVGHLRDCTDKYTEKEHMNWSCFGTPAESTAGQFARACQKKYGKVPGVCDRDYMTNSSHVPVYYPIKAIDKIRIEAPYHALENAGHIAYIEMDGDPTKNVKAFEQLVRAMHDANMGYFSINHPVDRDPAPGCGYTGIINNVCPKCGRREDGTHVIFIPWEK